VIAVARSGAKANRSCGVMKGRSAISDLLLGWDNGALESEADLIARLKKWVTEESMRRCWQCKTE
jgi:hypothetical protein